MIKLQIEIYTEYTQIHYHLHVYSSADMLYLLARVSSPFLIAKLLLKYFEFHLNL